MNQPFPADRWQERPLLIDVSRLVWRLSQRRLPTGIDRVCLAYLARFGDVAQAVVQLGGIGRILSTRRSSLLFDRLLGAPVTRAELGALLLPALGRRGEAGGGRLYLNLGHSGLDRPGFRRWLVRAEVRPIYLLHDLIPLTHPEHCRAASVARHARRVATMLETAAGIIANSHATQDALVAWQQANGLPLPRTVVAWLGTERLPMAAGAAALAGGAYFVALGTIEGRKNHLMLLEQWRTLASRLGAATPALIVIGRRGWEAAQAIAMLDRCAGLSGHVVELPDCDDETLARYLRGARALLCPSFVEGYGMPLAEAMAAGTPVIASDLPVFREWAGDVPLYVDPTDGAGWRRAILDFSVPGSAAREAARARAAAFLPPSWDDHFSRVTAWLSAFQETPRGA